MNLFGFNDSTSRQGSKGKKQERKENVNRIKHFFTNEN